jgi:hypothetical protein
VVESSLAVASSVECWGSVVPMRTFLSCSSTSELLQINIRSTVGLTLSPDCYITFKSGCA